MKKFVQYEHFDADVWVREDLKGQHKEHCLCYSCLRFCPADRDQNCRRANLIYRVCVMLDMVLPVWECPEWECPEFRP